MVEAGGPLGTKGHIGIDSITIGIDPFKASAPSNGLDEQFEFIPEQLAHEAKLLFMKRIFT